MGCGAAHTPGQNGNVLPPRRAAPGRHTDGDKEETGAFTPCSAGSAHSLGGKTATSSRLGAPHRAGIQAERKRKRVRSSHVAQAPRTRSGAKRGPARDRFCRRSYAVSRISGGICLPFCDRPGTLLVGQAGIVDLLRLVQTACSRAALIMEPAQDVPRSDC